MNSLITRLDNKIEKGNANDCWVWTGAIANRYGSLRFQKKHYLAHRAMYEIYIGSIPAGMCVCHKCDNPLCVNPDHLFLGTPADNSRDMANKGRAQRGERHNQAKLTDAQVVDIRKHLTQGVSGKELALRYGVTRTTISEIKLNKIWKHL